MKRFVKNPETNHVFVPGLGRIEEGRVLVGNEFAQYPPKFLVEVPERPSQAPLEATEPQHKPSLLTEPRPLPSALRSLVPASEAPSKSEAHLLTEPSLPVVPPEPPMRLEEEQLEDDDAEHGSAESGSPHQEKRPRGRPRKNG